MSRLYDNTPLTNLPQINTTWPESWNTEKWTRDGSGVLVEACIKTKSRIAVTDSSNKKVKYYILHVETGRAHKRKFDGNGKEIEPNFSETTKVLTGYLNSSYKTEAKGQTDKLSQAELVKMIEKSELKKISDKSAQSNTISFWIEESQLQKMELESGDIVRIKTKGNSPFIYTIGKVEGDSCKVSNFAGGDQVGASWTDKIQSIQPQTAVKSNANDEIGDDEWDKDVRYVAGYLGKNHPRKKMLNLLLINAPELVDYVKDKYQVEIYRENLVRTKDNTRNGKRRDEQI